ncbi:MAG: hypothetical protein ACPIOQ_55665 [Promethearchaeia archaeon]
MPGCSLLCSSIATSFSLTALDLSCNRVLDTGACALGGALRQNTQLCSLKLSSCGIRSRGCVLLCHGVAVSCSLTELDLSNNDMSDKEACMALSDAVTLRYALRGCVSGLFRHVLRGACASLSI